MRFEVTRELGSFLPLNIVNLSEFTVPEKGEGFATVDTLDVHAQSHDDLVVSIWGCLVFEADFHCFV